MVLEMAGVMSPSTYNVLFHMQRQHYLLSIHWDIDHGMMKITREHIKIHLKSRC